MDNNLYYSTSTSLLTFQYQGTTYSTVSAYQSGSQQDAHGEYAEPKLNSVGYHGIGAPTWAYTLASGSPAFGEGTNVCSGLSGCSIGTQDFFGDPITTNGPTILGLLITWCSILVLRVAIVLAGVSVMADLPQLPCSGYNPDS